MAQTLDTLSESLKQRPELGGYRWLGGDEDQMVAAGLTHWLPKTVVLEVAEVVCDLPRAHWEWESLAPARDRPLWVLRRVKNGGSHIDVGTGPDQDNLKTLMGRYSTLKEAIRMLPETQAVADASRAAAMTERALQKELSRISYLARFPGRCSLWPA